MASDRSLWDRQRNEQGELEPAKWFQRFDLYRLLGPDRSIFAAYNEWRISIKQRKPATGTPLWWLKYAEAWDWQKRAELWDEEQRRIRLVAEQSAIEDMNKRHINISLGLQTAGGKGLGRLVKMLDLVQIGKDGEVLKDKAGNPLPAYELSDNEIRHYLKEGIELERLTRGLPSVLFDVLNMNVEDLIAEYQSLTGGDAEGSTDQPSGEAGGDS